MRADGQVVEGAGAILRGAAEHAADVKETLHAVCKLNQHTVLLGGVNLGEGLADYRSLDVDTDHGITLLFASCPSGFKLRDYPG